MRRQGSDDEAPHNEAASEQVHAGSKHLMDDEIVLAHIKDGFNSSNVDEFSFSDAMGVIRTTLERLYQNRTVTDFIDKSDCLAKLIKEGFIVEVKTDIQTLYIKADAQGSPSGGPGRRHAK